MWPWTWTVQTWNLKLWLSPTWLSPKWDFKLATNAKGCQWAYIWHRYSLPDQTQIYGETGFHSMDNFNIYWHDIAQRAIQRYRAVLLEMCETCENLRLVLCMRAICKNIKQHLISYKKVDCVIWLLCMDQIKGIQFRSERIPKENCWHYFICPCF
jgi:hypothetical protein